MYNVTFIIDLCVHMNTSSADISFPRCFASQKQANKEQQLLQFTLNVLHFKFKRAKIRRAPKWDGEQDGTLWLCPLHIKIYCSMAFV